MKFIKSGGRTMKTMLPKMFMIFLLLVLLCTSSIIYSADEELGAKSGSTVSSKGAGFKFSDLSHEEKDPDSYTLVCLDSNLIPASERVADVEKRKEFNPVKNWLRKELLEKVEKDDAQEKLYVEARELIGGGVYYLIRLYVRPYISSSEHLTTRLWGGSVRQLGDYEYSASMLLFPQPTTTHALAYLLGMWSQLLNSHTVIHDWGLRLAATRVIFSDQNIKTLLGKNNFDPNPTTRKEKKQRLAPIESFALEVGTEGLQSLTVLPKYALGTNCQRLVVGSNWYKFFLPEVETGKKGDTINSLVSMAKYLYGVYKDKHAIHPKLQYFLDDEVTDLGTVAQLNELLASILPTAEAELKVFPADIIWKHYGTSPKFSYEGNKNKKSLFEALKDQKPTLESLVSIKKVRSTSREEPISRIVYTLPIPLKEEFYRFDSGRWFKVTSSRFSSIIRKMRDPSVKINIAALLPYTLEDSIGEEGLYQEDRYNRRIVAALAGTKQKGILLDRINIYFKGQYNQFEFGDLLLYDDKGQFYIVHVKRDVNAIDHHRAQVERCAEYLASELDRANAKGLLLQGCINGLYMQYGLRTKQTKDLTTHGTYFKEMFAKEKQGKATWDNYLKNKIFKNPKGQETTPIGKLKTALRAIDLSVFKNHQDELIAVLDAVCDCTQKKELPPEKVQEFFEAVRQLIEIKGALFPSGLLTEATRKKVTIVMAVIDDRLIEPIGDAERELRKKRKKAEELKKQKGDKKEDAPDFREDLDKIKTLKTKDRSKELELFKKQQLWGLDLTRQMVQRKGFKFNLMVINENNERLDWDAFGSTKEDPIPEVIDDDLDQTDANSKTASQKEKNTAGKKPKKEEKSSDNKSDSSGNLEKLLEAKIVDYQYTSTDINRLLHISLSQNFPLGAVHSRFSLSGGADDVNADTNDIVHCFNDNRYVLPPIISHKDEHVEKSPSESLMDLLTNSFFKHASVIAHPPVELIVPFNPGGHWVTFHILIPAEGEITFKYIDSLVDTSKSEARLFLAFLRGKYFPRTVKFEPLLFRIQPDGTSCGAVTVENIKDLFRQKPLPDLHLISSADILTLKRDHRNYMLTIAQDFDFDKK